MKLFPDALEYMEKALTDKLPSLNGKLQRATVGQKLDISFRIVDQVVGKPAQAAQRGGDTDLPPVRHVEVVKAYDAAQLSAAEPDAAKAAAEEPDMPTRESWLDELNEAAVQAASGDGTSELHIEHDGT